jgi:hypothetical protein
MINAALTAVWLSFQIIHNIPYNNILCDVNRVHYVVIREIRDWVILNEKCQ